MAFTDNLQTLLDEINGLTQAEKFKLSEMIIKESHKIINILETHPHFMNLRSGNKIPILDATDDYSGFQTVTGSCELPSCDMNTPFSVYEWHLGAIGCKVEICLEELSNDFLSFWEMWIKRNEDDINSAWAQFLLERFQVKLLNAIFRVAYFGDKSASANSSINATDGFIKQLQAVAYANPDANLVVIAKNEGATPDAQTFKTSDFDTIYQIFADMYVKFINLPGHDLSNAVWRLDRQLAGVFVAALNLKGDLSPYNCSCTDPSKVTQARNFTADNLSIFGIPVEIYDFTKAMMAAGQPWYNSATNLFDNKNIVILTNRNTMLFGYELDVTLNKTDLIWNPFNKKLIYDGYAKFGAGVPTDNFVLGIGAAEPTP